MFARRRLKAPKAHSSDDSFIFATESGNALSQRNYARALRKACDKAGLNVEGLPPISSHDLRHSAISRWVATSGLDVVTIARWAGDTVETILSTYVHEWQERERKEQTQQAFTAAAAGIGGS